MRHPPPLTVATNDDLMTAGPERRRPVAKSEARSLNAGGGLFDVCSQDCREVAKMTRENCAGLTACPAKRALSQ